MRNISCQYRLSASRLRDTVTATYLQPTGFLHQQRCETGTVWMLVSLKEDGRKFAGRLYEFEDYAKPWRTWGLQHRTVRRSFTHVTPATHHYRDRIISLAKLSPISRSIQRNGRTLSFQGRGSCTIQHKHIPFRNRVQTSCEPPVYGLDSAP